MNNERQSVRVSVKAPVLNENMWLVWGERKNFLQNERRGRQGKYGIYVLKKLHCAVV